MKFIYAASCVSIWKGYDYYLNRKVIGIIKNSDTEIEGKVKGSSGKVYNVLIDIEHPKRSKCDCDYAKDKKIVCKHKIALYFYAFPIEVKNFLKRVEESEKEAEEDEEKREKELIKFINHSSKEELKQMLLEVLYDSEEWVYKRFIRNHFDY